MAPLRSLALLVLASVFGFGCNPSPDRRPVTTFANPNANPIVPLPEAEVARAVWQVAAESEVLPCDAGVGDAPSCENSFRDSVIVEGATRRHHFEAVFVEFRAAAGTSYDARFEVSGEAVERDGRVDDVRMAGTKQVRVTKNVTPSGRADTPMPFSRVPREPFTRAWRAPEAP